MSALTYTSAPRQGTGARPSPEGPFARSVLGVSDRLVFGQTAATPRHVLVPQGPGLGVEMDWDFINANKVDTKVFE